MKSSVLILTFLSFAHRIFAGEFPPCIAADGQTVKFIESKTTEGGPAFSTIVNGQPVIVFNEQLMSLYAHSEQTRLFIYLHECGHQALGHTTAASPSRRHTNMQELAADCYAAEHLREGGATERDLDIVTQDLKLLRKDPDHPGHVKRISNVQACFSE